MKKILLLASLLAFEHAAIASCYNSNVSWRMYITNKTPNTLTLSCGANIASGATGTGSGITSGSCGGSATSDQCTYNINGKSGILKLTYDSCQDYNLVVNASVSTTDTFPLPFACHVSPTSQYNGFHLNGGQPCPTFHPSIPEYYNVYSVTSYFTVSQSADYKLVWTNVHTQLTKGQTIANKLAQNLMNTGKYISASSKYDGSNMTITLSAPPLDPYTSDTSCTI